MTKTELLTELANKTGVPKVDADKILKTLTEVIHEHIAEQNSCFAFITCKGT